MNNEDSAAYPGSPYKNHEHDLVRVEDIENGLAWETCKDCPYRTDAAPWAPMTQEELDAFNDARARAAMDGGDSVFGDLTAEGGRG